jgi:radical SAM superfamily enzyme
MPYEALSLPAYLRLLALAVEHLPPDCVIHRLTGDGEKARLIAPLWSADKKRVLGEIGSYFERHDVRQGKCYEV